MQPVVEVSHLTKDFGEIKAVTDLSFTVQRGEVYGFLGKNGAGKSTTIRMLLTLIRPTSGTIKIFGMDLATHRREILRQTGAVIERPDLYKYLSALENLRLFATMSGKKLSTSDLMRQLELVGLSSRAESKVKTFSQGMKQRLGIAVALVHDPQLIILDEPTNGLDPQGIADVRNLIIHLSRDQKKTLMISSHLLSEMEMVADSMLIIDKGKKIVEGRVEDLFDPSETVLRIETTDDESAWQKLQASSLNGIIKRDPEDGLFARTHRNAIPGLIRDVMALDINIVSFNSKKSLEDYFLSLTTDKANVATS